MGYFVTILSVVIAGFAFAAISIGRDCRRAVIANCRRLDGTWSRDRIRRERAAFSGYLTSLSVPLVLALPLAVVIAGTIDDRVMPLRLVAEAFSKFSPDMAEWKESLQDVRDTHSHWLSQNDIADGDDARSIQRELWYSWPSFAAAASCFVVLTLWFFLGMSRSALQEYVSGVRKRRGGYARLDVVRMRDSNDMSTMPPTVTPTAH